MNNAVRSLILGGLSISLLTGCLEDDFDYSSNLARRTYLYGQDASYNMMFEIEDHAGLTADVIPGIPVVRDNIIASVMDKPVEEQGNISVQVTKGQPAKIRLKTANNLPVDLGYYEVGGTIQFAVRVHDRPLETEVCDEFGRNCSYDIKSIRMTASTDKNVEIADPHYVDLTSAFHAIAGSPEYQTIKVPTSCFRDTLGSFNKTVIPLEIHSESDVRFDISEVTMIRETDSAGDVLRCTDPADTNEVIRTDDEGVSWLYKMNDNAPSTGWARTPASWGSASPRISWQGQSMVVHYNNANPGSNGGVLLRTADQEFKDVSRLIDNGYLRFWIIVEDYASHPTKQIQVNMEGDRSNNSQVVYLEPGFAEDKGEWVTIPLKSLFTRGNGAIEHTLALNLNKALNIRARGVSGNDTLNGVKFRVSNIQLTTNP
ncbi:hypothetical protein GZ77_12140 [Endozoicomonas montiporae]|uniref:ExoP galactose-binding-like domain-containing protein n=2 Tax=Endozoicomonas montiporae TaxID=1027273 RepID=A0A081N957_9GAMM|nr:putative glycoside hydrolase [Endozoicomonas montiporae]AMO55076.1 hypothetical protein EZMO1_0858 [Endozoicomonas montiporae CL-33]KEQ14980.1 hypothetical protein GZ77_12140 [Endozoicomonas montiporae]